ncbi:unnamed protein product, partial [marine sediment metagenome]
MSGTWATTKTVYSVSNGYIYADYSGNDLDPEMYNEITFKAVDTYAKTNLSIQWQSEIAYLNTQYYLTATNDGSQNLIIQFTPADADGYLTFNQALVSSVTNDFTFIITNRSYGS